MGASGMFVGTVMVGREKVYMFKLAHNKSGIWLNSVSTEFNGTL